MNLDLTVLISMSFASAIFGVFYFSARRKMTKELESDRPITYYTRKRIQHFFRLIMLVLIFSFAVSVLIILGIDMRSMNHGYSQFEKILLVLYVSCWMVISTGIGLYISGVFVEQYTMEAIKKDPEYSRIKVATKLLHGNMSHVSIFSGGMMVFLIISLFEFLNPSIPLATYEYVLYTCAGIFFGIIYGISQIRNLTWRSQMPYFLLITLFHLFLMIGSDLAHHPFNLFFLFFSVVASAILLIYKYRKRIEKAIDYTD